MDDPATWTRPWTFMIRLKRSDDQLYEYACHEGNHSMPGILAGARAEDPHERRRHRRGKNSRRPTATLLQVVIKRSRGTLSASQATRHGGSCSEDHHSVPDDALVSREACITRWQPPPSLDQRKCPSVELDDNLCCQGAAPVCSSARPTCRSCRPLIEAEQSAEPWQRRTRLVILITRGP